MSTLFGILLALSLLLPELFQEANTEVGVSGSMYFIEKSGLDGEKILLPVQGEPMPSSDELYYPLPPGKRPPQRHIEPHCPYDNYIRRTKQG